MPARRALRPNRLPPAPPLRRGSVHAPRAAGKQESSLDRVRRISREHNKPFDPTQRGTWRGSSKDLVVNGHRKGKASEYQKSDEEFILIETEPDDPHPYVLVNPIDVDAWQTPDLYALQFGAYGTTRLLVWADHLENAIEPAAEWLATYAPGHISTEDHVQQLMREVLEEEPGLDEEAAYEKATADLYYTESGYLTSYEWHAHGVNPSEELYKAAKEASLEELAEQNGEQTPNKRRRSGLRRNSGSLDAFQRGYLETALWSSTDNADDSGGSPLDENYSIDDIAPDALAQMLKDCDNFQEENAALLAKAGDDSQNGHDFWLTRNGHGAGFWDRGYPSKVGDGLSKSCKAYGSVDLYVGDDGLIHSS